MPPAIIPAIIMGGASVASAALSKKGSGSSGGAGTIDDARARFEGKPVKVPVINRVYKAPPPGYRPGVDPLYPMYEDQIVGYRDIGQPMSPSAMAAATSGSQGFARGGAVGKEPAEEPEEAQARQVVMDCMAALRGQSPNPKAAINRFIEVFGPEEYASLRQEVLGSTGRQAGGGVVRGPGGGMDDMLPAEHPDRKILLSDGEFVVPADVVSGLGDGSTDAGARKLHAMMDRVRHERTGTVRQPGKVSSRVLP